MGKAKLEMLLLAAAAIGAQLIGPLVETTQVKHIEELSAEELSTIERPTDYCIYAPESEELDT